MSDFILKTANIFYLSTRIHRYATTGHYVTFSNLSKKGLQWPRICQLSRVFIRPSSWNMIQSSGYATDRIYFMSYIPISWMRFYRSKIASDLVTWIYIKQGFWTAHTVLFLRNQIIFNSFLYRNRSSWIPSPEVGSGGLWDGEAGPKCAWLDHRYRRFIRYYFPILLK